MSKKWIEGIKDTAVSKRIKICAGIICVAVLITLLTGCGLQTKWNTLVDSYIKLAQHYIRNENYDSAVEILEKGMATTEDGRIKDMLIDTLKLQNGHGEETVKDEESIEKSVQFDGDLASYLGLWCGCGTENEEEAMCLNLAVEEDLLVIDLVYKRDMFNDQHVSIRAVLPIGGDIGSSIRWAVHDDGWGNSAVVEMDFHSENITVDVYDVEPNKETPPGHGLTNGFYVLSRNDYAIDL